MRERVRYTSIMYPYTLSLCIYYFSIREKHIERVQCTQCTQCKMYTLHVTGNPLHPTRGRAGLYT